MENRDPATPIPWHEERDQVVKLLQQLRDGTMLPVGGFKATLNRAIALLHPVQENMHGPLAMAIEVVDGRVRMSWQRPLEFLSFGPRQAIKVAEALIANADRAFNAQRGGSSGEEGKEPEEGTPETRARYEEERRVVQAEFGKGGQAQPARPDPVQPAGDSPAIEGARGRGAPGGAAAGADGAERPGQRAPGNEQAR